MIRRWLSNVLVGGAFVAACMIWAFVLTVAFCGVFDAMGW